MCTSIIYDGRRIDDVATARRLLGDANIIVRGGYPIDAFTTNGCTCPVDIPATAARLGRICAVKKSGDSMEYHLLTDIQMDAAEYHVVPEDGD